eukprot:CAMPEP_0203895634 /NCGR_PEP_ID=MMETSP0359-20131031/38475_1 /ASSEMBLY_ACC=CAM_ASM_000338 /TAXON_ID=268821 /ORGANISM="Scrippsiella Hangoei, Strain SHTV-5" /LENGTH=145 /DNA_ID=CAMNT_0050818149 /DNA_START=60 /DNA_END=493 /DNA_ORIENTATION=-
MELLVSVLCHRNLSHSNLILRNLYSTLQVGAGSHSSSKVEVEPVPFSAGSPHETVAITLRNGQTQTVMFVRNIPLNVLTGQDQVVTLWVAVYPPGDPRDLHFDPAPPRHDVAQVQMCLHRIGTFAPPALWDLQPQLALQFYGEAG